MTVKGGNLCNNWPDFPIGVHGATGGLIENTVMICGGDDNGFGLNYVDECYSLTSEKATLVTHMSVGRQYAASIVLNDKTLWVTGGYNYPLGDLSSTDYVTMTGTMPGPDLPTALSKHAMIAINSTCSIVIGGHSTSNCWITVTYCYSESTFYYDHNEDEWITGPSLMQVRKYHAAGIVTDEVSDEHFFAVTGGYFYNYLTSTEILQDEEWVQGKKFISFAKYLLENFLVPEYSIHCINCSCHKFEGT